MRHVSSDDAAGQGMFAGGLKTALLDDTRGRLAQAAIGAFLLSHVSWRTSGRITRRRTTCLANLPSST